MLGKAIGLEGVLRGDLVNLAIARPPKILKRSKTLFWPAKAHSHLLL